MKFMKFFILGLLVIANLQLVAFAAPVVKAGPTGTVLPEVSEQFEKIQNCQELSLAINKNPVEFQTMIAERKTKTVGNFGVVHPNDVLGCAIKTGDIKLWMVPFFIRFILELVISLAGILAVGGFIYGGFLYLFAGISDDKEKGKNAIKNSVIAMVLILTSWAIVNIVIALVSG